MLCLAESSGEGCIPLKSISEKECISQKYLESIMADLKEAGLVIGTQGKGGGYVLSRPASSYSIGEILRSSEDSLATVACLERGFDCPRAESCKTLPMWKKLDSMITGYLDTVSLTDLLEEDSSRAI
jgi:Rrf2 family protein